VERVVRVEAEDLFVSPEKSRGGRRGRTPLSVTFDEGDEVDESIRSNRSFPDDGGLDVSISNRSAEMSSTGFSGNLWKARYGKSKAMR